MKSINDKDVKHLIDMNARLLLLLGYSTATIFGIIKDYRIILSQSDNEKYKWLKDSIENLIYLDKPLPPCP